MQNNTAIDNYENLNNVKKNCHNLFDQQLLRSAGPDKTLAKAFAGQLPIV